MNRLVIVAVLFGLVSPAFADDRVSLPENYRESFVEYLTLDRTQNHDQFIRLFADATTLKGVDESGELPEGAVIVAEVYKARKDKDGNVVTSILNRRIPENMALIAVMEKRAAFAAEPRSPIPVGNWDFGAYKPDGTPAAKNLDECRACHAPLTDKDFVFSIEHLPSANSGD